MNFYIRGQREITVNKTGAIEVQHCNYQPWQTPTKVTNALLASATPVEDYKAWVMGRACDIEEAVYADDDHFCENAPIGIATINYGKEECEQVDSWMAAVTAQGYDLEFYTL